MKKYIILTLVLGTLLSVPFNPIKAQAQQANNVITEQVRAQLVQLLLQQIALLQAQIQELLVNQARSNQAPIPGVQFQILFLNRDITERQALVVWETTLPSRSRLMLPNDGKVYESRTGIGTRHSVVIDVQPGREYNYRITARTLDDKGLEDDLYGSFLTPTAGGSTSGNNRVIATLGGFRGSCRVIIIKDTDGRPVVDMRISVRGTWQGSGYIKLSPQINSLTNTRGEIEYCYEANKYEVSGDGLWVELGSLTPNSLPSNIQWGIAPASA